MTTSWGDYAKMEDYGDDRVLGGEWLMTSHSSGSVGLGSALGFGSILDQASAMQGSGSYAVQQAAAAPMLPPVSSMQQAATSGPSFAMADAASYFGGQFDGPRDDCEILTSELASPDTVDSPSRISESPGAAVLAGHHHPHDTLVLEEPMVPSCAGQSMDVMSLLQAPAAHNMDGIIDPSPGSVYSPPVIKQEQTRCTHCLRRLRDMLESYSVQCQSGARKWEQNWRDSGASCFGACQSSDFCTDHGYPLPVCHARHDDTRHCVFSYRGTWVMQRAKRDAGEISPGAAAVSAAPPPTVQPKQEAGTTTRAPRQKRHRPTLAELTSSSSSSLSDNSAKGTGCIGGPRECVVRLEKLRSYEWVCNDARAIQRIREAEVLAQTQCQGFCRTQYCCKIHWCPAHIHKEEGKATRYRCPHPHESKGKKGRHHLDYAFYCPDVACCNGKWYSRDETHNRRHAPRQAAAEVVEKLLADGVVSGARADAVVAGAAAIAGTIAPEKRLYAREDGDDADEEDPEYDAEAERLPLVSTPPPTTFGMSGNSPYAHFGNAEMVGVNCVPADAVEVGAAQHHGAIAYLPPSPTADHHRHDSQGSIMSVGSSLFPSIASKAAGGGGGGSPLRLRGRIVMHRAVFIGLVALCGILVLAAAVPSAILARSLVGTTAEPMRTPLTRMCWSARWIEGVELGMVHIAERCEDCTWVERSGRYLCSASAADDRKLSLLATIDPSRNILTGYYVHASNATDMSDTTERALPCVITITPSLPKPLAADAVRRTVSRGADPVSAIVKASEDSWTFVITRA